MTTTDAIPLSDRGYAFLQGGSPYSQAVVALSGYAIERVRFREPIALMRGFEAIEAHLAALGRPRTALCAAELRSPKPFTMEGFGEFNRRYVDGIISEGRNPVARSNVAPEIAPPREPTFYAFSYSVPAAVAELSFVVSGSGEWPEGGRFPEDIAARGDLSLSGLRAKVRCVLDAMERRLARVGASWRGITAAQIYTVHDIHRCWVVSLFSVWATGPATPGTSAARRFKSSSSKWTCAVLRRNTSSPRLDPGVCALALRRLVHPSPQLAIS
jgi:hypothetical protein